MRSALGPTIFTSLMLGVTASSLGCSCAARKNAPDATVTVANPSPAPSASASASATALVVAAPSGTPLSKLVPRTRPTPRPVCPLAIESGVALGPVDLGSTLDDLKQTGLRVSPTDYGDGNGYAEVGPLKVSLCAGKVIDVWMDDLRLAPDCVTYLGKPIAKTLSRDLLEKRLGPCGATPPRTGGQFERCQDGGVYVGHGMGEFIQIRVQPKGYEMDETCARMLDDGSTITLSARARALLLERTVNLRELAPFWHPDHPGRDPLRIVRSELFSERPRFKMFGSEIVWIEPAQATTGTAFFELRKLAATKTRAWIDFGYPIEGVSGTAEFRPQGDDWVLHHATLRER